MDSFRNLMIVKTMNVEIMFPWETEAEARQRIAAMRGDSLTPEERAHLDAEDSAEKILNELNKLNKR